MAITVTDKTFAQDVTNSTKPVIVDLWAPWCQPCKAIEKELAALDVQFAGKIVIAKVNVDENPATVSSLEIKSVPTLLFYAGNGASPLAITGATTAKQIVSRFRLLELPS
ncbi:TrxA Thiol-disulfide isomerase and thioredoxins [uncultured Caudovirales phage]|uniref:TrxA Thiol-disulfide isomerase and thioredoxins n=1 Tax=uncultured Caudovirales phage TaxID=2100421 RepID=A0A6J5MYJ7_9CAUD|nr:TrxA Thiol-disulfide isomerase and thioredoxins [uncultured Caudovirales phage]CAB4190682.1 TrxA Thiol-disulfide isomerase and thioredoxins [uncultured Caudovirales phage]CAB4194494.1 TrxA Thiol-disulfide isomerase and thioredoxins [uncultured Caudovirales phage]